MILYLTELCDRQDESIGWGVKVVADVAREAGCDVRLVSMYGPLPADDPDAWLVSLPYAGNMPRIRQFFRFVGQPMNARERRSCVFLLGGHGVTNPDPLLDVFDLVFLGDADDAGGLFRMPTDQWSEHPGVISEAGAPVAWQESQSMRMRSWYAASFDSGDDAGKVGKTMYLEVAKGCAVGCSFCELGWAHKYAERTREETESMIQAAVAAGADRSEIVLSAPHTDGVRWFDQMVEDGAYDPRWRSTTVFRYSRSAPAGFSGKRGRIRFGVEGVTERLRVIAGKKISNEALEAAVHRATAEGYRMMRVFLIGGLPTETAHDRQHIEDILGIYRRSRARHWKAYDIKVTGLSPQPFTPLQRAGIKGAIEAVDHYRAIRRMMQRNDPYWRSVLVDTHTTEADVLKHMRPGQLLRYLTVRGDTDRPSRRDVRAWAEAAGLFWDEVLYGYTIADALPWGNVRHPNERKIRNAERLFWQRHITTERMA